MWRLKPFFNFSLLLFVLSVLFLFKPFFFDGKLPIPSDTIVGLYHPFRDLYVADYPNGIPYKNFLITDPVRQQYPWRLLAVEQEKQLELPLWNPYSMAGTPLLGGLQAAAFYPLNLLLFVFPFSIGWSILILLQPLLAGVFSYFYLRNLGLYRISSLLGAFSFAFCGFSVAWLEWGTVIHTAIWLPLLLLSTDKIFLNFQNNAKFKIQNAKLQFKIKNYIIWSLIFIFSLVSSFFAGHLQTFFYVALVVSAYFLVRWFQHGKSINIFILFLILVTLYLILTAVQWYPTMQFIAQSARNIDQLNWQHIEGWFIPWQHLVQFVAPDFFGNPTTLNYWGTWNYGELVGYVGIIPLVMALYALFFRRDRGVFFFGTIFFISLIFALPTLFAQLPYQFHIPFISTAQPTRLLFLTDFALSILAAFGMDWYIRHNKRQFIFFPVLFVGIILGGLWLFVTQSADPNSDIAKRNLYFPTLLFGMTFAIIVINTLFKNKKIFFVLIGALLLIATVDLLRFTQKFTPFTRSEYLFPQTSVLDFLQKDTGQFRIMTTDSRIMPPNFAVVYHLQSVDGYDPLYLRRYAELIAASERGKPDISPPFGFNRIITPTNINSPIIDLLGVKYVLSFSELSEEKFTKVSEEGLTKVYKNNNALPRAYFVKQVKLVETKQEAINTLFDKNFNLRETAVVENPSLVTGKLQMGDATIVHYTANTVVIDTENRGTGFLVLTDTYYPTWRVAVCDQHGISCTKLAIHRTNYNFRGVVVPLGKHRIIFENSLL